MKNHTLDNLLVSISRLVAIDSAGVAIAEIDLREGGILIGGGNIGKTSILNAIRLFLLPEENFKNSEKKFGFCDKEGNFFSDDESFEHYFPSHNSFLILECDNYLGGHIPHCQILYRGSTDKLDYRRMFTSLRYEQIRHLFWDLESGEDGIGGRVDGLSPSKVQSYLKQEDKYFKTVMRSAAIKELIYANQLLDIDAMRFCLFPLNSTADADVSAFRALVRLLFDMKTGSDTVRLAVANIIESQKKERKDELNFDIDEFVERNDALARREELLNKIRSMQPHFEMLAVSYQKLMDNHHAEEQLMQFALMAENALNQDKQAVNSENAAIELLVKKVKDAEATSRRIQDQKTGIQAVIDNLSKQKEKLTNKVERTQQIIQLYDSSDSIDTIVEGHKEHLATQEEKWSLKQDADKRSRELESLNKELVKLQSIEKNLHSSLEKQEFKLFNQLPNDVWNKLAAVNLELAEANPSRPLAEHEVNAIRGFTDLITPQQEGFSFYGIELEPVVVAERESDQIKLNKVQSQMAIKKKRVEELGMMDSEGPLQRAKTLRELENEIKHTREEIELLQEFARNQRELRDKLAEMTTYEAQQQALQSQFDAHQKLSREHQQELDQQKAQQKILIEQLERRTELYNQVIAQLQAYGLPSDNFSVLPDRGLEISQETLFLRIHNLKEKRQSRVEIAEGVQAFVRQQVLENDDQLMSAYVTDEQLNHAFQQLKTRYDSLEGEFDILRKNFIEHKLTIHSIINELKTNREMVRQFEQSINRAFAGVKINDLAQVEANIRIEARFNDLVAEIEHLDTHSDQKASAQFIERLKAFSRKFFPEGKAALLTMDQVVAGIAYRVIKQGQTRWETKSQSTSTIMLINLKLVEILLGRLKNKACTTQFPLIIDEGASVDSTQFDWLLPNMREAGFRVLSASTTSASSEVIYKFGQHFRLDSMRTGRPYDPARTIAYTGKPDCFVPQGSRLDREQLEMFGESDE
ncbi:hypothetical protein BOO92_03520 [Vibrio navarrensis]|uniref:hypothetical protein n=1 Tax=Vibrio navarrensis TaxID=29495 RepID=UPI001868A44D|nr:hypothetical protein [Vibrio navarrensis]MBE3655774.1 hypothetical protein [Vibrio navarrensis]